MGDDDMSIGEIARSLRRIEQAQSDMLPLKVYTAEHQALQQYVNDFVQRTAATLDRIDRQFDEFRRDAAAEFKGIREAVAETPTRWADKAWTRILAAGGVMAALTSVVIAAFALRKG